MEQVLLIGLHSSHTLLLCHCINVNFFKGQVQFILLNLAVRAAVIC